MRGLLLLGVTCLVASARTMDLLTTRIVTPDLAGEQNIALSVVGPSWPALIGASLALVALTTGAFAFALHVQPSVRPKRRGLRYVAFLRFAIWGHPKPLRLLFQEWPPRRRWAWAVGRFLPWAVIATSLAAATGNVLAHQVPAFRLTWYYMVSNPLSQATLLAGIILAATIPWSHFEHRQYRRTSRLERARAA